MLGNAGLLAAKGVGEPLLGNIQFPLGQGGNPIARHNGEDADLAIGFTQPTIPIVPILLTWLRSVHTINWFVRPSRTRAMNCVANFLVMVGLNILAVASNMLPSRHDFYDAA